MKRKKFCALVDANLPDDAKIFKKPQHGYIGRAWMKDSSFLFVIDNVVNSNSFVDSISRLNQRRTPYAVFDVLCVYDDDYFGYTPLLSLSSHDDDADVYIQSMRVNTELIRSFSCVASFGMAEYGIEHND